METKNKIWHLKIEIRPWDYTYIAPGRPVHELRIEVQVDGVKHVWSEPVEYDDLRSRFDYYIDRGREALRHLLATRDPIAASHGAEPTDQ